MLVQARLPFMPANWSNGFAGPQRPTCPQSGSPIAKVEHVLSSLNHVLFDQVLRQLTESSDGGTAGAGRVGDGPTRGEPLDPSARTELPGLLSTLRETFALGGESVIDHGGNHGQRPYPGVQRTEYPDKTSLQFADTQAVISQALRKNQAFEWISYGMALLRLYSVWLSFIREWRTPMLVPGRGHSSAVQLSSLMVLLPFRFAINARRHNIALRMLE